MSARENGRHPIGAPIRDIVIVGGGTTGWLTAAHLNHRLQWSTAQPHGTRITLIESPELAPIGVGEATIPPIRAALNMLDIDEAEFIARTNATFKMGVRFDDWDRDAIGTPGRFFHPFNGGVYVADRNPIASLLAYGMPDGVDSDPQLAGTIGHGVAAIAAAKSPRRSDDRAYNGALNYAYHFDAGRFADFLREVCVARGVEHIRDTVVGVTRTERGHIATLNLAEGGARPVELVVDCSGFRGLLINEALGEPFVSYADHLPNDRAVTVQFARDSEAPLLPATVSTATDTGWRWRIPLQSRVGTGHVYCTAFADETKATDALIESNPGAERLAEPRVIPMRIGRSRKSWVGNCVAIGLSSGFLEPLESTSIQFVDYACRRLLRILPSLDFEPEPIAKFNWEMERLYEEVRDFLGLHFTLGNREDTPYWRAIRHEAKRSDALQHCLDLWARTLPDSWDRRPSTVFNFWSVSCVLLGKGFYHGRLATGSDLLPRPDWERHVKRMVAMRDVLVESLPDHAGMLREIVAGAQMGATVRKRPVRRDMPSAIGRLGRDLSVMSNEAP